MTDGADRNDDVEAAERRVAESKRQLADGQHVLNEKRFAQFKDELGEVKRKLDECARQDNLLRARPHVNEIPPIPGYVEWSSVCNQVQGAYEKRVGRGYDGTEASVRSLLRFDAFLVGHVLEFMEPCLDYDA